MNDICLVSENAKLTSLEAALDTHTHTHTHTHTCWRQQGTSADGGHYVSWTRKDDGTWFLFDDDKVLAFYGGIWFLVRRGFFIPF